MSAGKDYAGYSVFGSLITPIPKLNAYARYDSYDPNNNETVYTILSSAKLGGSGLDDVHVLFIAGLDYIPTANLNIMPNLLVKSYAKSESKKDITGRLTLYAKFDSGKIIGE